MRKLKKLSKSVSVTTTQEDEQAAAATLTVPAEADPDGKGGNTNASTTAAMAKNETLLSPDIFKHFDKTGRSEFLKYLKQQLQGSSSPVFDQNGTFKLGISNAIYQLLWQGIRFKIKKEIVLHVLNEVVALHADFPGLILDVVNLLDSETSLMTEGLQEERHGFVQIVKDLEKVVSEALLKERLEIDTLQEVGIVKNKSFYTKFIKVKTKLYYKQRRFNLFREESEGFAKLITELNQDFDEHTTPESIMDIIKSLIGCFNLDPNRVLDIIIESFETRPDRWHLFIPLLRSYMPTGAIICEVLGYKFCHFKTETRTPRSLFHVCALLLKHGVIELDDIYVWLTPNDSVIRANWEADIADAREMARKLNLVCTNKKDDETDPPPPPAIKKFDEEQYTANQKFGLCEALLKVGDWENALKIIQKLPEQSVVVQEPIAKAIVDLLHLSVEHLYYKKCFKAPAGRKASRSRLYDDAKLVEKLQAREFSELRNYIWPMANVLGPGLHYDTILMYKLIRIMHKLVVDMGVDCLNVPPANSEAEQHYFEIISTLDACILPSLLYLDHNCSMSEEVWTVLKYFPYHYRYSLYARWKNESYQMHPNLIRRCGLAQREIKSLMSRVTTVNVKQLGRQVGKKSHSAPGVLYDYILLQIQVNDGLISPVCDMLKYTTFLSFDCLGYCIIESLTLSGRGRFKDDSTSLSFWLQNLASFCGSIFKKYPIELSGLLQYVANQLKSQKSLDLLILRELVHKMAGVESAEDMTNDQLQALCGGEQLRGEAGYFSQVRNTKKSSYRLKEALANNDLTVTLCLLMAQQKHCVIYRETAHSHLKVVSNLYDQCQDTLVQFGTFLGSTYSVDEYVERLPSIITMLREYHIHTDVAFFLARPMFTHQINQKYDQLRKADPNAKKLTTAQKQAKYLEATQFIMSPIVESVRPLHSAKVWEDISPQFLVTFWSLSMYDLHVPNDSYQREINKLKQLAQQAAEGKDSNQSKNKKEQERYIALMDKLNDERKKQHEHVEKIQQRLQEQKDSWFLLRSAKSAKNDTITQFLQLCLFPRCTFTALDALYCAKFVHTIHNLKTSNFSTLLCYDRIFCDITNSVTSCTEGEATRYGRFLCAMLETVMRWHSDQAVFNKECANYPGFVTKFRVSNQFSDSNDHVGYENYRHVCHKWHYKITKSIVFCLDSKDFMQIRNALIILIRILPFYPVLAKLAQIIERKVDKVREDEKTKRPDLYVMASSYLGNLKLKTPTMLKESDFHLLTERPTKESPAAAQVTPIKVLPMDKPATTVTPKAAATATSSNFYFETKKEGETKSSQSSRAEIKAIKSEGSSGSISNLVTVSASGSERESRSRDNRESARESAGRGSEVRDDQQISSNSSNSNNNNSSSLASNGNGSTQNDHRSRSDLDRDHERHSSLSSHRSSRDNNRSKDREAEQRSRERSQRLEELEATAQRASKRDKARRDERSHRHESVVDTVDLVAASSNDHRHFDEYEGRTRDRDLSSVSNESNGSLQHRRSHETIEYEKDSKRRKLESSSSSSKKVEELVDSVKKARGLKTKDRNKDKLSEEERDARKDRKLGRKRDRNEESGSSDHKRRREAQNGEDDLHERERRRDKSPRERSHEKFERDRGGSSRGDDRQYSSSLSKSTRSSRANY